VADFSWSPSTDRVRENRRFVDELVERVVEAVIGQKNMIGRLIVGLLCNGYILIEGVRALAKTTVVQALSNMIGTSFKRLQFTPNLLPTDLIETQIEYQREDGFHVKKGPVFAKLVLADVINRAPAIVQIALLEPMQEHQVKSELKLSDLLSIPRPSYPESDRRKGNILSARTQIHVQITCGRSLKCGGA